MSAPGTRTRAPTGRGRSRAGREGVTVESISEETIERAESLATEALATADSILDELPGQPAPGEHHGLRRRLIVFCISVLIVSSLLLAVPGLNSALGDIGRMRLGWIVAAVALEIASNICFAVIFRAFFSTVPGPLARRVAWSEVGSGALLPGGGVTSYALGGVLLHRAGLSRRRIVVLSGGLFWLTTAVNALALLIGGVLIVSGAAGGGQSSLYAWLPLIFLPLATAVVLFAAMLARRSQHRWEIALGEGVQEAARTARRGGWRLLGALGYLGFDMAVLWCTFRALGYLPSIGALMLGYLIGYLATIIPIPGGIGVLEGGLAGALVLYGTPATKTIAAVLVYHAIAFWVPSLGGLFAYSRLRAPRKPRARANGRLRLRRPDPTDTPHANETTSFRGVTLT
jgi:uncharacterized membrane protein YbhN (UPF0104 family)